MLQPGARAATRFILFGPLFRGRRPTQPRPVFSQHRERLVASDDGEAGRSSRQRQAGGGGGALLDCTLIAPRACLRALGLTRCPAAAISWGGTGQGGAEEEPSV
jgi:hypothetical protein